MGSILKSTVFRVVAGNVSKDADSLFELLEFCDFFLVSSINYFERIKNIACDEFPASLDRVLDFLDESGEMKGLFRMLF